MLPNAGRLKPNAELKVHNHEHQLTTLRVTEGVEALEGVANERQAEVGVVGLAGSFCLGTHLRRGVDLRNLVDREVLGVDGAGKLGLERSTNLAETVPVDTAEEGVLFELGSAAHVTQAVLGITDEAEILLASNSSYRCGHVSNSPSDEVLRLIAELLIRREGEVSWPVDNLAVCVMRLLGAEWRPADQALEHDCANTPPIAALVVALATEDFRRNVIRCADSRVSKLPARLAPCVDLVAVRHRELDLIDAD